MPDRPARGLASMTAIPILSRRSAWGSVLRMLLPFLVREPRVQEAIEELLDAIYYLTRQVARLEDLREKIR